MHPQSTPDPPKARNVTWNKQRQKWRVEFRVGGKKRWIGDYADFAEAKRVADETRPVLFPDGYRRPGRKPKESGQGRRAKEARRAENRAPRHQLPWCKRPENRARQNATMRALYRRRRDWYAGFMNGRVCGRCGHPGSKDKPLQWHHRSSATKAFPVSRGVCTRPIATVLFEVAKCDLLCRACHLAAHGGKWSNQP